jgi:NTE family protein
MEWGMHLAAQVEGLTAGGSQVEVIVPDSDTGHLFGANAMDFSLRAPAAQAGYSQGQGIAGRLIDFWR